MNLVLFDIDGTLTRTVTADEDCFSRAYEEALNIPGINTDWSVYSHCVDSTICREIIQSRWGRFPEEGEIHRLKECLVSHLLAYAKADPSSFLPVPGVIEVLDRLRRTTNWVAAVATGAWECSARLKLNTSGVNINGIPLASADDGLTREEILAMAIQRAEIHSSQERFERIVSVGDGVWDVICATRMGLPFIGIAEGPQRENLLAAGATDVHKEYPNPDDFMRLLDEAVVPGGTQVFWP